MLRSKSFFLSNISREKDLRSLFEFFYLSGLKWFSSFTRPHFSFEFSSHSSSWIFIGVLISVTRVILEVSMWIILARGRCYGSKVFSCPIFLEKKIYDPYSNSLIWIEVVFVVYSISWIFIGVSISMTRVILLSLPVAGATVQKFFSYPIFLEKKIYDPYSNSLIWIEVVFVVYSISWIFIGVSISMTRVILLSLPVAGATVQKFFSYPIFLEKKIYDPYSNFFIWVEVVFVVHSTSILIRILFSLDLLNFHRRHHIGDSSDSRSFYVNYPCPWQVLRSR